MAAVGARDIWSILTEEDVDAKRKGGNEENSAANETNTGSSGAAMKSSTAKETYVLFLGDKQSGKSTAVNMFLNPTKDEKPKPTVALEYTYGRKSSSNSSAKDIAHIWELGGGGKLSGLIKGPLSLERIQNFHAILCVNLEKPNKALDSLQTWIGLIRGRVSECMEGLRRTRKGSKVEAKLTKKRNSIYAKHAHVRQIDICPIPITIVCPKYDKFADQDPVKRKVLLNALRYVAFSNGAAIYCVSRSDKTLQQYFRGAMNSYCFGSAPRKGNQLDSSKPVIINFGVDSSKHFGIPAGASSQDFEEGSVSSAGRLRFKKWKAAVEDDSIYPQNTLEDDMDAVVSEFDSQSFQEEKVDAARAEKDRELAQYKHEAERKQRIANEMGRKASTSKKSSRRNKKSSSSNAGSGEASATQPKVSRKK